VTTKLKFVSAMPKCAVLHPGLCSFLFSSSVVHFFMYKQTVVLMGECHEQLKLLFAIRYFANAV